MLEAPTQVPFLNLAVIAASVGAIASLVGIFVKDFIFARSLESWKNRKTLRAVFIKYRDPLFLATVELVNRLEEVLYHSSVDYLDSSLLEISVPEESAKRNSTAEDPHYQKYKLVSTIYRLCAWLGWLELYRREITFLDSGHHRTNERFDSILGNLRSTLADGFLNKAPDWHRWKDALIFREEQRAIGEAMIEPDAKGIIGYGTFCERLLGIREHTSRHWYKIAAGFILDLKIGEPDEKDFRRVRFLLMLDNGLSLARCLDSARAHQRHAGLQDRVRQDLSRMNVSIGLKG